MGSCLCFHTFSTAICGCHIVPALPLGISIMAFCLARRGVEQQARCYLPGILLW